MGFKLGAVTQVRRKVEFKLPGDDGKPARSADFVAFFRLRDVETLKQRMHEQRESLKKLVASLRTDAAAPTADDGDEAEKPPIDLEEQYLREDLIGLEGITDIEGNPLEFNSELLDGVLNDPSARAALFKVHHSVCNPEETKRKN